MGLRFRKTVGSGAVKTTLGKSGASVSAGAGNVRVSRSTTGSSRATVSAPGTGFSYVSQKGKKSGGSAGLVIFAVLLVFLIASCGHGSKTTTVEITPAPTPEPTVELIAEKPETEAQEKNLPAVADAPTEETPAPVETPEPEPTPEPTPIQHTYILNTSSRKYHLPSCSSVKDIKPSNYKEFTGTTEELEEMGYQACKRCG